MFAGASPLSAPVPFELAVIVAMLDAAVLSTAVHSGARDNSGGDVLSLDAKYRLVQELGLLASALMVASGLLFSAAQERFRIASSFLVAQKPCSESASTLQDPTVAPDTVSPALLLRIADCTAAAASLLSRSRLPDHRNGLPPARKRR